MFNAGSDFEMTGILLGQELRKRKGHVRAGLL